MRFIGKIGNKSLGAIGFPVFGFIGGFKGAGKSG